MTESASESSSSPRLLVTASTHSPARFAAVMPAAMSSSSFRALAAAALMAFEGVHRIPVVDDAGRVSGVITTLDVLRWLAQEEGYLAPRGAGAPR